MLLSQGMHYTLWPITQFGNTLRFIVRKGRRRVPSIKYILKTQKVQVLITTSQKQRQEHEKVSQAGIEKSQKDLMWSTHQVNKLGGCFSGDQ